MASMVKPVSVMGSVSLRSHERVYGSQPLVWSRLTLPTQSGGPLSSSSRCTFRYTDGHHWGSVSALPSTSLTSAIVPGTRQTVTKW